MERSSPTALDDVDLLRRYATSRDATAFAELVRRHAQMVFFSAKRASGRSDLAEDVSQDCFLQLARHARTIRGSVAAWLHTTAINRARELLRSDTARRRREVSYVAEADDDTRAETVELIAIVDAALESLPADARTLIVEHYLSGIDQATLARRLGVDQSTVSRRVQRALEQLRDAIRKRGGVASIAVLPTLFANPDPAPATLVPGLTKIGLAGVTAKPAILGLTGWLLCGAGAAAAIAVSVVLFRAPDPANPPAPPAANAVPQLRSDEGWFNHEIGDGEAELEGTMAEIPARDVDALQRFYIGTLGFNVVYRGQDGTVILKRGDANIALSAASAPQASSVSVFVEEVDATYTAITRAGGKPDAPPAVGRFGLYGFSITDPEGNHVRFLRETKLR